MEGVRQVGVAAEAVFNHEAQRHFRAVGKEAVHVDRCRLCAAKVGVSCGRHGGEQQVVKLRSVAGIIVVVVVAHVFGHLCVRVERVGVVNHARLAYHVSLPGVVHFGIVVRCARYGRPHDVGTVVEAVANKVGITCGRVVFQVGGISTRPQQETHGHLAFEHVVGTGERVE